MLPEPDVSGKVRPTIPREPRLHHLLQAIRSLARVPQFSHKVAGRQIFLQCFWGVDFETAVFEI